MTLTPRGLDRRENFVWSVGGSATAGTNRGGGGGNWKIRIGSTVVQRISGDASFSGIQKCEAR